MLWLAEDMKVMNLINYTVAKNPVAGQGLHNTFREL